MSDSLGPKVLKFTAEMFNFSLQLPVSGEWVHQPAVSEQIAKTAQAAFESWFTSWLAEQPTVYAFQPEEQWFPTEWTEKPGVCDTHTARLVAIEPLKPKS